MLRAWLILLVGCAWLPAQVTVVLLRHAEKTSKLSNAELSQAGKRRARGWAADLSGFQPIALFASDLRRTQQTLEPLADQLGLPLQIYLRGSERELGQRLRIRYQGRTVIVCGHSDTLMELVAALGYGKPFPEIQGFDRYWVLRTTEPAGAAFLQEHVQARLPR